MAKCLRVEILFNPNLYLTSIGTDLILESSRSHLGILNSAELIKQNTSNQDTLKIGESFYIYFHSTRQYVYYSATRQKLCLTRSASDKTLFKILSDEFDWRSGGRFELNKQFKYRIIMAEHNAKCLAQENSKIVIKDKQDEKSLISLQLSQYSE